MYKKRTDIIDILEHLGRTGGKFPAYLTQEDMVEIKRVGYRYYDCIPLFPFKEKINNAYKLKDNEELMRYVYILIGYFLLEKFIGSYGSPTRYQPPFGLFDQKIEDFLYLFAFFNGGNYYIDSYEYFQRNGFSRRTYRTSSFFLENSSKHGYEKLFNEIKSRDLNKYFDEIEKQKEEEKKAAEERKIREQEYRDWLIKQDWYPEYIQVNQAKAEISKNKQIKKGLGAKIDSLNDQIKLNQEQQIKLEAMYNKKFNDLKRKRNLSNLKDKSSNEILTFILDAEEPFDLYEPLFTKLDIQDISSLSQEKLEKFKDKASKSNKKSGFRKLLKSL